MIIKRYGYTRRNKSKFCLETCETIYDILIYLYFDFWIDTKEVHQIILKERYDD